MSEHGTVIDLNTDYMKNSKTGQIEKERLNPGLEMLSLCKEKNVPLVIGSDAHSPEKLANNFIETFKILKKLDIKKLFYFKNRELFDYKIV